MYNMLGHSEGVVYLVSCFCTNEYFERESFDHTNGATIAIKTRNIQYISSEVLKWL